jgi:hypothetical protein
MKTPDDYLESVRTRFSRVRGIRGLIVIQEQVKEEFGLYRYRLDLTNGDLLEAFERFRVHAGQVEISKYSFHWQNQNRQLIARWDTAPHHPTLPTFPHHIHDGAEEAIHPHAPVTLAEVLAIISQRLAEQ